MSRVRAPDGVPSRLKLGFALLQAEKADNGIIRYIVGVDDIEGPPVPIPNTEVKLCSAEDSALATRCENRKTPTLTFLHSSVGRASI